nr:MAG: hypothetical protein [Molluscum contagiosum virus]
MPGRSRYWSRCCWESRWAGSGPGCCRAWRRTRP